MLSSITNMMKEAFSEDKYINLAKEFSFELVFHKRENCLLRFHRDGIRIDYWYTTGTVGIMIPGLRDRFVRNVPEDLLVEIFASPEGYELYR
jgi:hypothetical protein